MSRRSAIVREGVVLAAYTALALVMTYPLASRLTSAVPGPPGDNWQHYWNLWWIKRAIVDEGVNPLFATTILHPAGGALSLPTMNLTQGVLAVPIVAAFGVTVAYNLVVLLGFVGGAYCAYRLALHVLHGEGDPGDARPAAFLAGVIFAFSASHFSHLAGGHLEMVSVHWLPCGALLMLRCLDGQDRRDPWLAAVAFTAAALTTTSFALGLYLFTAVAVLHALAVRGSAARPGVLRVGLAVGAHVLLVALVLWPMFGLGGREGHGGAPAFEAVGLPADPLAYFWPSPLHPLWGDGVAHLYERFSDRTEAVVFLGYTPLLLVLMAARVLWARRRLWVLAAVVFILFSLGPERHVMSALPYVDTVRSPSRLALMVTLCVAVLTAEAARSQFGRRPRGHWLLAGAGVLILFEQAAFPFPMTPVRVPAFYERLAADSTDRALVEVPNPRDARGYTQPQLYQTRHGKPRFGGSHFARNGTPLALDGIPGLAQFQNLTLSRDDVIEYPQPLVPTIARTLLNRYGAGWVAIDKKALSADEQRRARSVALTLLGSGPVFEDDDTSAYAVPAAEPAPPFVHLDVGWSDLERDDSPVHPEAPRRWRRMGEKARLGIVVPRAGVWRLVFKAWALEPSRRLAVSVDGGAPAELEIPPMLRVHRSDPFDFEAGSHWVELRVVDGADRADGPRGRFASMAMSQIALEELPAPSVVRRVAIGGRDAEPYMGAGWSFAEPAFRWTTGRRATLHVPAEPGAAAILRLNLDPFVVRGRLDSQRVDLELDGSLLRSWRVTTPETMVTAALPATPRRVRTLILSTPDAAQPSRFGGRDDRELGVALRWLELLPSVPWPLATWLHPARPEAQPFLGGGWSRADNEYRWTEGDCAEIVFRLDESRGPAVLEAKLHPWAGRASGQRVLFLLNGRAVGEAVLVPPDVYHFRLPVSTELARHNVLTIVTPEAGDSAPFGSPAYLGVAVHALRVRPYPRWPARGVLPMGGATAEPFLGAGWGIGEGAFRWALGPHAELLLGLAQIPTRPILRLSLQPFLNPPGVGRQRIGISINDRTLAELELKDAFVRTYDIEVPRGLLRGRNILRFDLPDAAAPASVGLGADRRLLAVAVHDVGLLERP